MQAIAWVFRKMSIFECRDFMDVLFSQNDKDNMHKLYQSTKVEHDKPVEGTVIGRLSVIHIYSPLPFEYNRSDSY